MTKKPLILLLTVLSTVASVFSDVCIDYTNSCTYPTCNASQDGGYTDTCYHSYCDSSECFCIPNNANNLPVTVSRNYKTWNNGSPGPNAIQHCQSPGTSTYDDPNACCDCDTPFWEESCTSDN